jgi:hypothetical protein
MIKFIFQWKGKNPILQIESKIRYIKNLPFVRVEGEAANLADKTVEVMQTKIDTSRKRPDQGTHKLENSIDWTELINDPGRTLIIGIGNIAKMKEEAPYFEVIDAGGYTPVGNIGFFTSGSGMSGDKTFPEGGSGGQTWVHTGKENGSFFMKPSKAIEGIDYTGEGQRFLEKEMDNMLKELGEEFMRGLSE